MLPVTALLFFITLFSTGLSHAANITVSTSRNPVALDDSFHLVYEADSDVDGEPDFTPIYEHFDILNSGQSTNMRYINGNYSLKKSWDLAIIAKDIGKFTIPPIAFGKDISPAIQITISNSSSPNSVAPDGQASVPAKIFLESSIDKKQGWVQSQFIYTVRLLRTVSIASASITEPKTNDADAIIQPLSEDSYQTSRNGIKYEVFERRYAIFPQKSGTLKISPVTFEGRVNATQPRTIFDQFRMSGQLKRLRSKTVEANVKAAPANIKLQDWLPASALQLVEEWSDDIQNIKVGEPVTRTITIAAEGLTGVQLPDLDFEEIDGLKQYPDKAIVEDRPDEKGITGLKQMKIALIPARGGSFTLPEIKLQWWNTKTNKTEFASLPATVITAAGKVQSNEVIVDKTGVSNDLPAAQDKLSQQQGQTDGETTSSLPAAMLDAEPYWKWVSLFFATAWLLTLILLLKRPGSSQREEKTKTKSAKKSLSAAVSSVEKHARQNDARDVKKALIQWAQLRYADSNITNLTQITKHCSAQLGQQIKLLDKALYSSEHSAWHGNELLNAFKTEQKNNKHHGAHTSSLRPLYNIEK